MLDINMPVMNGYETMKIIREKYPGIKVLTVSMYETEFSIIQMFRLGAKGYLEKSCDAKGLRLAFRITGYLTYLSEYFRTKGTG